MTLQENELLKNLNEIYTCLTKDPKIEVRVMAMELISGLSSNGEDTTDPAILEAIASDLKGFVSPVFELVLPLALPASEDVKFSVAQLKMTGLAWDTLINWTGSLEGKEASSVSQYITKNYWDLLCQIIFGRRKDSIPTPLTIKDSACKLLSNLSKHYVGEDSPFDSEPFINSLLGVIVAGSTVESCYDFLCSCLADLSSSSPVMRSTLVKDDFAKMKSLLPIVREENTNPIKRGGIISAIKNCLLLSPDCHLQLIRSEAKILQGTDLQESDDDGMVLCALASRLLDAKSVLSEEERERLPLDLQLREQWRAEPDCAIRTLIIETLIILASATRIARQLMRTGMIDEENSSSLDTIGVYDGKGFIYPILREWHKLEPVKPISSLLENLVSLLINDEEKMTEL